MKKQVQKQEEEKEQSGQEKIKTEKKKIVECKWEKIER